jgi:Ca2+-binding EF-hand superfamily protein
MKYENDRKHLTKIMTLIAIKLEEKFITLGKGFLFFDQDGDHAINRQEFHKGIESMRVKLAKADVEQVFDHLDADGDGCLSYTEFCGFAEEKRRNIDPFDAIDFQKMGKLGLNESSLAAL